MVRFLASADWQLGMTAHFLDDESRPRYQQARFDAVRRLGDSAREHGCAFIVVGGDVFESNQLHRSVLARAFEALRTIDVPVYLLPGNHDPLDAGSIFSSEAFRSGCPEHVHVLDSSTPVPVGEGVEVVGAPWLSKRPLTDLVAGAVGGLEPDDQVVRILVGHGAVDTLNPDTADPATIVLERLTSAITERRVTAAILGDRHSTTEVASRVWYPGTPEVTDRKEPEPGQALVVEVDHHRCEVTPVRLGQWQFTVVDRDLNSGTDVTELDHWLRAQPDKEHTALWLALRGTLTLQQAAQLDEVLAHAGDVFAKVTRWERHEDLSVLPDDHDLADLGLSGFAQAAADELVAQAESDHDTLRTAQDDTAGGAQDALGLLYRLAAGAR